MTDPTDQIVEAIRNTGWGGDFGPKSDTYATIQLILRGEFDRGVRVGLENAFYELDHIFGTHISDHPERGLVALVLDLAQERLDLR